MNRPHQVGLLERLGQEVHGARFHCAHGTRDVAMPCDEHDLRMSFVRGLALQIEPVDVRELDIQNQA